MSYRLEKTESLPDGIRRIAAEQIDTALRSLTPPIEDRNAIHNARKACKKVRAVLRLVRDEIGDSLYRYENERIRDAARELSALRDAAVLVHTLDRLAEGGEETLVDTIAGIRDRLTLGEPDVRDGVADPDSLAQARRMLELARCRVERWPVERDRFVAIADGIKRVYRGGRRAYGVVVGEPSVESLHDWRKQVKYLWYHLRILKHAEPATIGAMAEDLRNLSEILGDDHDLAVLRSLIVQRPALCEHAGRRAGLLAVIDERRLGLQESAKSRGARLYAETPKVFVARIEKIWEAWRDVRDPADVRAIST